jgi:acyl-ACP thioesterase
VLLDIKTRRPQLVEKYLNPKKYLNEKSADVEIPQKIIFPEGLLTVNKRKVVYSDIDLNGHVSNIKYLEWFLDIYDYDFLHKNTLAEFELNFLNECRFGQILSISKIEKSNIHYGLISRIDDKKEVFRIKLKWG